MRKIREFMRDSLRSLLLGLCMLFFVVCVVQAKEYVVTSPDKKIVVKVSTQKDLTWEVKYQNEILLNPSKLAMSVKDSKLIFGESSTVKKVNRKYVDEISVAVVPTKSKNIRDNYNEMSLICNGEYTVTFRVYDNGAAYRFETNIPGKKIFISNETVEFNLGGDYKTYWPRESNPDFITHCEGHFDYKLVSEIEKSKYAYLPIYLASQSGTKMVIMDADLSDYPNLFLFGGNGKTLTGQFPPVILEKKIKETSDRDEVIISKAGYLAKTDGKRTFPWRLLIINPDDRSLLENNLVYQLSTPSVNKNTEWIKPGKISWDWWSTLNVYGVDFDAGVNTDTYKYFIDFAAKYGIEYVLLDEGWSAGTWNIKEPKPGLDLNELIRYGKSKNVGLVLWTLWNPLSEDMEGILDIYQQWGIKGIKVDFMQRSDQDMVNFYENVGKAAFDRHILVDFHGSFKPSGLHRKYPNVMTYEGVYGMEHNKCSNDITPDHNLILPFTRMVAGPMDYTPGATNNVTKDDFHMNFIHPMAYGTRAHQSALYVVFESPLQMLADSPSNYYRFPEYAGFISQIPTVWDQTKAIEAEAGKFLVLARKSGDKWYLGAITNWDARSISINLDFLDNKKYKVQIMKDGANANVFAQDCLIDQVEVVKGQTIQIDMAKGGGWAAILTPME